MLLQTLNKFNDFLIAMTQIPSAVAPPSAVAVSAGGDEEDGEEDDDGVDVLREELCNAEAGFEAIDVQIATTKSNDSLANATAVAAAEEGTDDEEDDGAGAELLRRELCSADVEFESEEAIIAAEAGSDATLAAVKASAATSKEMSTLEDDVRQLDPPLSEENAATVYDDDDPAEPMLMKPRAAKKITLLDDLCPIVDENETFGGDDPCFDGIRPAKKRKKGGFVYPGGVPWWLMLLVASLPSRRLG